MKEAGDLIARECHAKSAHVWLGPTVNIQRYVNDGYQITVESY
jgi:beta-glucosidase-like glycosyl hydrolase